MRQTFLPFTRPSITEAEIREVSDALRSGWITSGPRVATFEKEFSAYVSAPFGITVTSATAGFHILLQALGIGPGDEVISASLTWPSPVNMVEFLGARPVFADIDVKTFQLDPLSVERVLTPRTKAIIPVHFGGQPCDLDAFRTLSEKFGLTLIEDAAHAIGAEYRGQRIGSGKNPAVFSFHAIKNLTTGEGGLITVSDEKLRDHLMSLRFHGVNQDAWKRYAREAAKGYDLFEPGWKYNLTDLQAALGLAQLRRIKEMNERRRKLAELYDRFLDSVPEIIRPSKGFLSFPPFVASLHGSYRFEKNRFHPRRISGGAEEKEYWHRAPLPGRPRAFVLPGSLSPGTRASQKLGICGCPHCLVAPFPGHGRGRCRAGRGRDSRPLLYPKTLTGAHSAPPAVGTWAGRKGHNREIISHRREAPHCGRGA